MSASSVSAASHPAPAPPTPTQPRPLLHPALELLAEVITEHPFNNVTDSIFQKIGVNLHQQAGHPIGMIKGAIYDFFDTRHPDAFKKFDNLQPLVTAQAVSSSRGTSKPAGRTAGGGQGCRGAAEFLASLVSSLH